MNDFPRAIVASGRQIDRHRDVAGHHMIDENASWSRSLGSSVAARRIARHRASSSAEWPDPQ